MWVLGDLVGLPFLAAQIFHLMREDESDATRIDAELDAREAQPEASQQALWWQDGPLFTDRFKPTR